MGIERKDKRPGCHGVGTFLSPRTCIFSDHKKNNPWEEFYFESRRVDHRLTVGQRGLREWVWVDECLCLCVFHVSESGLIEHSLFLSVPCFITLSPLSSAVPSEQEIQLHANLWAKTPVQAAGISITNPISRHINTHTHTYTYVIQLFNCIWQK